ncbi:MAG: NAD-dependent dehydrogenase subunit [uncultured bacterium]|nr:MAG: NAD-dependent dehydrogenase subunit [uncultured bacterium]HBH19005.1 hydrogenase [Cyanobacteria bacterium UBA9579]
MIEIILNILFLLIFPFLFIGLINKTKAFWAGRKGASIFQPFYDFVKLLKKGQIISTTTSQIFVVFPSLLLASVIFAGLLVPIFNHRAILSFEGSFILFAYILALGKFLSLAGAMDTGSSFEGMGASREASFSTLVEPAFFIMLSSIMALSGNYSFKSLSLILQKSDDLGYLIIALGVIALLIMMLIEGCRVPVDDPNTHLELTMIHEVMILDNSGIDLAIIMYSSWMKLVIFASLIANIIIPANLTILYSILAFVGIISALAIIIGTIESTFARLRLTHIFQFAFMMSSISLIILALTVISIYKGD